MRLINIHVGGGCGMTDYSELLQLISVTLDNILIPNGKRKLSKGN